MADQNTTRAFWVQEPGAGAIRSEPLPAPSTGEVLVRSLYSGISRGTESLVFRGGVPASQRQVMRGPFQAGEFPAPVKYGYMNVGIVEDGHGTQARELVGRPVFCLFPHQERYVVPAAAVTALPDAVPPARAVLAANVETAVNGVWDGGPGLGDRVAVVGGGVVGLLVSWLCSRIPGVRVTLVDPNAAREPVASALGVAWTRGVPSGLEADLVFHASGHPAGLRDALTAAAAEATVVELSWFGDQIVPLPLGEGFHPRRLTIRSSQVGRIPPEQAPRWTHRRRMALALELLADPVLDVLVTGESAFEELPELMPRLSGGEGAGTLCHRIRYPDTD